MMTRWSTAERRDVDAPDIDAFLNDLLDVCRKHNMGLGHEDQHGAFEVCRGFDESLAEWLMKAHLV